MRIPGIHHVTAIAAEPRRNLEFYVGVLGLRLVKRTVNFDDPGTYHLYYGDELGRPGTILTFFPWPGAPRGRQGTGQVTVTAYSIPRDSLGYWTRRLSEREVEYEGPTKRFDESVIELRDPDGLKLELVALPESPAGRAWTDGPIPLEHAVRGFHGITVSVESDEPTAELLVDVMGFEPVAEEGGRRRFRSSDEGPGRVVDLFTRPGSSRGLVAAGTVHHVAFRAASDEGQRAWRSRLLDLGFSVTPVLDRQYFRSIYFREPGGVLFEIATDGPGFTTDEPPAALGRSLKLPPWLEERRDEIEGVLPPLGEVTVPERGDAGS